MDFEQLDRQIDALSKLFDPLRRSLYLYVASRGGDEVGRDEAAEAVSISRSLAAFHLDKLAGDGFLEVSYRRPQGRSGPGAGRPAKFYRRTEQSFEIIFPSQRYELAAQIFATSLAQQVERSKRGSSVSTVEEAALSLGERLGAQARSEIRVRGGRGSKVKLMDALSRLLLQRGFQPTRPESNEVRLASCPFGVLSSQFPLLVCGMNRAFMEGILRGANVVGLSVDSEPEEGRCCIRLRIAKN